MIVCNCKPNRSLVYLLFGYLGVWLLSIMAYSYCVSLKLVAEAY
jgi:hypothetical protein